MVNFLSDKLINFLSAHFEAILSINFYLVALAALVAVLARLSLINSRDWEHILNKILLYFVVGGEVFIVIIAVLLVWINYKRPNPVTFEQRVLPYTFWVKSKLPIYYVVDNTLMRMAADGTGETRIFEAQDQIREYHFSPDGRYILIVSTNDLDLLERKTSAAETIDTITINPQEGLKGVIRNVQWSPDSRKICYEIAKWSAYAGQNHVYIYDLSDKSKRPVLARGKAVDDLTWDVKGQNLYYTQSEAMDTSRTSYPYEIKIYKVGLDDLTPKFIEKIPFKQSTLPSLNLQLREIKLYKGAEELSFGRQKVRPNVWVSPEGPRIGIDADDHLYYVRSRWWRKRLYPIPRMTEKSDFPRYQHGEGRLVIEHIQWLPGGRYVVMEHPKLGILVLDPAKGEMGQLTNFQGTTFGWYPGDAAKL